MKQTYYDREIFKAELEKPNFTNLVDNNSKITI